VHCPCVLSSARSYYVLVDDNGYGRRDNAEVHYGFNVASTAEVAFYQVGASTDFTGTVLTVDGVDYDVTAGVLDPLRHGMGSFNVQGSKEILNVDESTNTGKLLARGPYGFFDQPKGFGAIIGELERKCSIPRTSGGSTQSVQSALKELVA
jgi:hypothetical protein